MVGAFVLTTGFSFAQQMLPITTVLATHSMPLSDRYAVPSVNTVFKDNILLTAAYMENKPINPSQIDWNDIERPFTYEVAIPPHGTFAFHDAVLNQYAQTLVKTSNAHFDSAEGFKSDGYLVGDGVCHFASLLYWTAKDAGLDAYAPTNHNFAVIPDVPKEYGVAIYTSPDNSNESAMQNLYITNNKENLILLRITYVNDVLSASIEEVK
jgi:hypothetical protein